MLMEPVIKRGALELTSRPNLRRNLTGLRREGPNHAIVTVKPHPSEKETEFRVRLSEGP